MELLCDRKSGESPGSPRDFLSSSGDYGDSPDFSNMADDDSEHGNSTKPSPAAKKKKKNDVACCAHKGNQLNLEQRKMISVSSMMFVVIPDGNHRDKHNAQKFLQEGQS